MYARVLAATDGTPWGERAVAEAAALAAALGSRLTLVHVVDEIGVMRDGMVNAAEVVDALRKDGERALARGAEIARAAGVTAELRLVEGAVADTLIREGSAFDVVVIGTHGRNALGRLVAGSVAHALLSHLRVPLLVVGRAAQA